ncbi:P-loop containing nucleoside triphosphate hydrolase protein [Xylariaceae sp. FL0594]|nr:P-loop containing nucleoside triphosphate hydrolase protein [Xylariaceae sp. FL0594]
MPRRVAPAPRAHILQDDEAELNSDEWEWIYQSQPSQSGSGRSRRESSTRQIVGARNGEYEFRVGDCAILESEGANQVWVAIIMRFVEADEDGDMAADFLWFSPESEIRNGPRKRTDFLPNELYITTSSDINPLASINGKARVLSHAAFLREFPTGKIPRSSAAYNKTFVCRRGCNARTTTYTDEFVWEDVFSGSAEDITKLIGLVRAGTKSTRRQVKSDGDDTTLVHTPRKRRLKDIDEDEEAEIGDDDDDDESSEDDTKSKLRTPRKKQKTSRISTPSSRNRVVIKKALEFTPLATRFLSPSHHQSTPFQIARAQLHVASVPETLPCRETEFALVYSHLEAAITDGSGACIYISGTPGTGKTATVREVVSRLDDAVRADELDDFIFVEINGMKITDPHQAYSLLWEALRGQRVSPGQALDLLEREFSRPSPRRVPCVVLMDELDQLVTRNQGVMYNFFNWPGLRHSRLVVLAVANTMDLPERTLSNKISSRLGLTRVTFPGYNHEQLMRIIQSRLEGVPGNVVEPDAVQFASRKVAAVSGDARRALDICRRAVEIAEAEAKSAGVLDEIGDPGTPSKRSRAKARGGGGGGGGKEPDNAKKAAASRNVGKVTIATVKKAINEATTSPLQQYLRGLPFAYKVALASLLLRVERTGLPDSTYGDVLEEAKRALVLDASSRRVGLLLSNSSNNDNKNSRPIHDDNNRLDLLNSTSTTSSSSNCKSARPAGFQAAALGLAGAGIIILEGQRAERPSKVRLAVGDEEVKLALRDDPEIKALGIAF